ncbi:MAG: permease, partial [Gemmataceae bacterium]
MNLLTYIPDFVVTFSSILWEALPFIVVGALIAGILEELLPQQLIAKVLPRYAVPAVMLGGMLGLIFPMCECGIVVVMRRLLRKGLPLACCVSYMLAGPIVNLIVLFSTYVAFGGLVEKESFGLGFKMVLLRAGFGFLVACGTGLVVYLLEKKTGSAALLTDSAKPSPKALALNVVEAEAAPEPKRTLGQRIDSITHTALHDFLDITVFLIIGAILASIVKEVLLAQQLDIRELTETYPLLSIPGMMLLAVVLCLCSEADAFVAASFTEMPTAPKLAFLVLGPMLDLKLILMYTRVFRLKLILTIIPCVVLQVFVYMTILSQIPEIN